MYPVLHGATAALQVAALVNVLTFPQNLPIVRSHLGVVTAGVGVGVVTTGVVTAGVETAGVVTAGVVATTAEVLVTSLTGREVDAEPAMLRYQFAWGSPRHSLEFVS